MAPGRRACRLRRHTPPAYADRPGYPARSGVRAAGRARFVTDSAARSKAVATRPAEQIRTCPVPSRVPTTAAEAAAVEAAQAFSLQPGRDAQQEREAWEAGDPPLQAHAGRDRHRVQVKG